MTILLIRNSSNGGLARNVEDIARELFRLGIGSIVLEPSLGEFRFRVTRAHQIAQWTTRDPVSGLNLMELLNDWDVTHCHIHSKLSFRHQTWSELLEAINELGIKYDVTLHDYSFSCPRVNLVDFTRKYCGEPDVEQCEVCIKVGTPPQIEVDSVRNHRKESAEFLQGARRIFVPTHDVAERYNRQLGESLTYTVRPHRILTDQNEAIPYSSTRSGQADTELTTTSHRRIFVLGTLTIHKGSELVLAVAKLLQLHHPEIKLIILGSTDRDQEFSALANTEVFGAYDSDRDLSQTLEASVPDLIWFPSVWPETYSYTLGVAMSLGLKIAFFDYGGIKERTMKYSWGYPISYELLLQPDVLAGRLEEIAVTARSDKFWKRAEIAPEVDIVSYYEYPVRGEK